MKRARPPTARFVRANTRPRTIIPGLTARGDARSDPGLVRERNEDCAHADPEGRFYLIADGIGGHPAGDVASQTAVELVRRRLASGTAMIDDARLAGAVREAHDAIRRLAFADPERRGMGTTFDAVAITGTDAIIAHAGDSRVYLLRDNQVTQLTRDHTLSPTVGVLINALGVGSDVAIDVARHPLRAGDRLLLCTDGLYDYFRDEELAGVLSSAGAGIALDELVELARARGGDDNITGILVEISGAPTATDAWEDETTVQRPR